MKNMMIRMRALVSDDAGQDLLEYALLVGLIALVAVGAVTLTGTSVSDIFGNISDELDTAADAGGAAAE
jgi:pilus assembly protein Flp/PilA